jgi:hypothetical protein
LAVESDIVDGVDEFLKPVERIVGVNASTEEVGEFTHIALVFLRL